MLVGFCLWRNLNSAHTKLLLAAEKGGDVTYPQHLRTLPQVVVNFSRVVDLV